MTMTPECIQCSLRQMDKFYSQYNDDPEARMVFQRKIMKHIADAHPDCSPPEINGPLMAMVGEEAGIPDMFKNEKHEYNMAILKMQDEIWEHIQQAEDKLYRALQYAMTGNYIDFGTGHLVSEAELHDMIEAAVDIELGESYTQFRTDLGQAKTAAYLLDNCGEIVFDKMCIAEIKALYPELKLTAVVRGLPSYNDVLMADAEDVGLTKMVPVIGNGMNVPGTVLKQISSDARDVITGADIVIAKGMGNYETLVGCGLNVYYLFLCKCERLMREFNKPRLASVFLAERA